MDIVATADYTQICKTGSAPIDECFDAFEKIIEASAKATGNSQYRSYFENIKAYGKLVKIMVLVKSSITILYFQVDNDCIATLSKHGYKIIIDQGTDVYTECLNTAMLKSDNLISKINSRLVLIRKAQEESKGNNTQRTFEEEMAHISATLQLQLSDDLTLSRYNEYGKIIKERNRQAKQQNAKRNGSRV